MKEDILKIQASAFNALAHPLRLKVLEKLRGGPCCVCKIIPYVGCEQPNVSHHLAILRRAGIVHSEKRGTEVWYDVVDRKIFDLIDIMVDCIIQNLDKSKNILRVLMKERT
jgi:ArsR family transcriptional regulator